MSLIVPSGHNEEGQAEWTARLPLLLFLAGALVLLLAFGLKAWRLAQVARSMQQYQVQATSLAEDGLLHVDPDIAEDLVMNFRRDVRVLNRELRPLVPLASRLGWVPRVGPVLEQSEAFMEMADSGSMAAAYSLRGLKPALQRLQADQDTDSDLLSQVMPILAAAQPDLFAAGASLDRFVTARSEIASLDPLPWRVRMLMELVDEKLYLAEQLQLLAVLPDVMGTDEPRTYLILAQNEDELRPTGGFISGAGLVTVEQGDILELTFQDANVIDDWHNKPYEFPPEPYYELMGLELFLFRDANFWPDFPISAEKAMELYQYGQDHAPDIDGVIAIDQQFVAMLLSATGPVAVPELETTIDQNNVVTNLRATWGPGEEESLSDWVLERKDFLGPLAQAIQLRLLDNFDTLDPLYLADTIHRAVRKKHLQIYVRDPFVAAVLDNIDYDGRLERPASGDYLMIVETNVGYNKVNPLIERSVRYDVEISEDSSATARLTISYVHTGHGNTEPCVQVLPYVLGITYDSLINQCYWNYLRVYVPGDISPIELQEHRLPMDVVPAGRGWQQEMSSTVEEVGTGSTITTAFVLSRGDRVSTTHIYESPRAATGEDARLYRLEVRKQQGLKPYPLTVQVTIPEGATVDSTSHPAAIDERQVTFEFELQTDQIIELIYR